MLFKSQDFSQVKRERAEQRKERETIMNERSTQKPKTYNVMKNPLMMYEAINMFFSLHDILVDIGCDDLQATNCLCPFHGEMKGISKASAKYFEDSDTLYCYQEQKSYTAYHALKMLNREDMNKKFQEAWNGIDEFQKNELIDKYGAGEVVDSKSDMFAPYSKIKEDFINGVISFKIYKTALRKVMYEMYSRERAIALRDLGR